MATKLPLTKRQIKQLNNLLPWWGQALVVVGLVGWAWWQANGNAVIPSSDPPPSITSTETSQSAVLSNQDGWYEVDRVVDGDTIRVMTAEGSQPVRLIGIDTPESVDPRKPVECLALEASEATKKLVEGQRVRLVSDDSQSSSDRYQRWLRYAYLEDGRMVNLELLKLGFAMEYTYDQPYAHRETFRQAEGEARERGRGLWGEGSCLEGSGG